MVQLQMISPSRFMRASEKGQISTQRTTFNLTLRTSVDNSPSVVPIKKEKGGIVLSPPFLALTTIDDGTSFADQALERPGLVEFFDPTSGRNINQDPMDKQNWE